LFAYNPPLTQEYDERKRHTGAMTAQDSKGQGVPS